MVRSVVGEQSLLNISKKKSVCTPPSLKKRSVCLKKHCDSLPASVVFLKEEMIKKELDEEEEDETEDIDWTHQGSPRFRKSEVRRNVKRAEKSPASRWSATRYQQAEVNMLKIMKSKGAVFGNPVSRTALRSAARSFIGDTGLLDHLLKHMDGKVAPGGCERFRRWHNNNGKMEYWLESANLFDMRNEAGIQDPYWMPPPGWNPGCSPSDSSGFAVELKILREEMDKMKRDFQVLILKKTDVDLNNLQPSSSVSNQGVKSDNCVATMQSELENWKEKIKKQLYEISNSLGSVKGACLNLGKWKVGIEQKLFDMSISVSSMQTSRRSNTLSPSAPDNWDFFSTLDLAGTQSNDFTAWLGGSELIDLQQTDYDNVPWIESSDLIKIEAESPLDPEPMGTMGSNPVSSSSGDHIDTGDLEIVKEEMSKMKRKFKDAFSNKDYDGHANASCDSSVTDVSKQDLENSVLMLQEFYKDVVKMKADIERQVNEISTSLHGSEQSTQDTI